MGQAKRRGTFEQRVNQAKARNAALEHTLLKESPVAPIHQYRRKHGTQRLATVMVAAGLLASLGKR